MREHALQILTGGYGNGMRLDQAFLLSVDDDRASWLMSCMRQTEDSRMGDFCTIIARNTSTKYMDWIIGCALGMRSRGFPHCHDVLHDALPMGVCRRSRYFDETGERKYSGTPSRIDLRSWDEDVYQNVMKKSIAATRGFVRLWVTLFDEEEEQRYRDGLCQVGFEQSTSNAGMFIPPLCSLGM